jgi:hypothetical protein
LLDFCDFFRDFSVFFSYSLLVVIDVLAWMAVVVSWMVVNNLNRL